MPVKRTSALSMLLLALGACGGTEGDLLRTRGDAGLPDGGASSRPRPAPLATWQIQLSGNLDTSVDVQVYVADLETSTRVIGDLHAAGRIVLCYFSAGTSESFRDDASRFPAASLGPSLPDYPDERWVDPRNATVRALMGDRIAKAAEVGCDGLHPSGLGAFAADNGLGFTRADQLDYDRWLAASAHARGLSVGLVATDASLTADLVSDFDWTVVWSCVEAGCASAAPFLAARKAAVVVEYGDASRAAVVCPAAKALGMSALVKRSAALDAYRAGCP